MSSEVSASEPGTPRIELDPNVPEINQQGRDPLQAVDPPTIPDARP